MSMSNPSCGFVSPSIPEMTMNNINTPEAVGTSTRQQQQQQPIVSASFVEAFRNKPTFGLHVWNHLILTLDGRDKLTKLLQYTCRLLAWCYLDSIVIKTTNNNNNNNNSIRSRVSTFFIAERFAAMKNSLATSRKAFRLGRSMAEIQKLQSLGIIQWIDQYLNNISSCSNGDGHPKEMTKILFRALSDIMSSLCHPLALHVTSKTQTDLIQTPLWNIAGNSIKSLGLLFFWAADNISFLLQSGFLDDYQQDPSDRFHKRTDQIVKATNIANRSYFIAAIAGLVTNWISYWNYSRDHINKLLISSESNDEVEKSEVEKSLQKSLEKQFSLFVALIKSVCDVIVFSNNTGVDLWRRYRGRPLYEGLHCLCGIVSASVVLYNNYPNVSDIE